MSGKLTSHVIMDLALLALALFGTGCGGGGSGDGSGPVLPAPTQDAQIVNTNYIEHPATRIDGNNAFNGHSLQGNGTSTSPYIIENWEIKTSTGRAGLHVSNTTAFFIIQNCYIHDESDIGIELGNVLNCTIKNCVIKKVGYMGIDIEKCENITVINNEIRENGDGGLVEVYNSSGINIENNNLVRSGKDNVLVVDPHGKGVMVINNQLIGEGISDDGVDIYSCKEPITSEAITYMGVKTNLLIKGNYISGHYSKGVEFNNNGVNDVIIAENIFDGDIFSEDGALGNGYEHKNALIVRNTFKNNARAIIYYGNNFKLYENNFLNNTRVDDTGTNNFWYDADKKRGNYWQECTIPDNDKNGVCDSAYTRHGSFTANTIIDSFPLFMKVDSTVLIIEQSDNFSILSVYPNPNNGSFVVKVNTKYKEEINICVYDLLGKKIYEEKNIDFNNQSEKQINLEHLQNGIYFMNITNNNVNCSAKVVIQRKK